MAVSESATNDTIIILQARTSSKRFPGKVLKELQGIPMLSHSIRRLKRVERASLVVATTTMHKDDAIEELASKEGVSCFRGDEADVLDRFYRTAKEYSCNIVIRATGDNPLVDPVEAERVLDAIGYGNYHYVTGFFEVNGKKLPEGVGVEAFSFGSLEHAWYNGSKPEYREHINNYFFDNPELFSSYNLECLPENNCPQLSLTVDTPEEFSFVERIGDELGNLIDLSICEIIQWWKETVQVSE